MTALVTQQPTGPLPPPDAASAAATDGAAPVLLYALGFGLAGLTVVAQAALAVLALTRACRRRRRHGDCLYGLCAHAAIVGAVHGAYVTVAHTLLMAGGPDLLREPLWRLNCKAYLFCRALLPGLFLHLLVCVGVAFKTVRYPARRCRGGRAAILAVHCLPWAVCGAALVPALALHKDATEEAIRAGRCALPELWPWLAPLLALFGAPQLALLLLTCLLCAFRPYADTADNADNADASAEGSSVDEEDDDSREDPRDGHGRKPPPRPAIPMVAAASNNHHRHPGPPRHSRLLLRGRPMRIARLLLIVLNCLEAVTQLPYSVISLLQTVLRNRQARHLIPEATLDIVFWLHLAFFPVASVFLAALVVQLDKAFQGTELELQAEAQGGGGGSRRRPYHGTDEVLYTASMLSSV